MPMKKLINTVILLAVVFGCANVAAFDDEWNDELGTPNSFLNGCDAVKAERATYILIMMDENDKIASVGTAVAISATEAVTAFHVVIDAPTEPYSELPEQEYRLYVAEAIGQEITPTYVLKEDEELDLALISGTFPHYLNFHQKIGQRYAPVWALGFPHGLGKVMTKGRIQSLDRAEYMTTASLAPGNSGGALLVCNNGSFEIVGINVRGTTDSISFSVSAGAVQYFLDEL